MNGLAREYGQAVTLQRIDVEDPDNAQLVEQYAVTSFPLTVILDSRGNIVARHLGLTQRGMLKRSIERTLGRTVVEE